MLASARRLVTSIDGAHVLVRASDGFPRPATDAELAHLHSVAEHPVLARRIIRHEPATTEGGVAGVEGASKAVVTLTVVDTGTSDRWVKPGRSVRDRNGFSVFYIGARVTGGSVGLAATEWARDGGLAAAEQQ